MDGKQPVGMIGLGIMGTAMSKNLLEAGFRVVGYDIAPPALEAFAERDVLIYGSGPRQAYDRCLSVFRGFSRAPHYLGPFGNGSKMKYVANLLVAIHTVAAAEAFALARRAGLDPAQMFEVVSDGAGGSRALQVRGPMLIADSYLPIRTMPLDLWRKDLGIIGDFANTLCCPAPLFSASVPLFNAAVASGYGDQDTTAVYTVLEALAGLPVHPPRRATSSSTEGN
jgi:L-threonate 2-dehydrogenase